jgi:hypothetical protein
MKNHKGKYILIGVYFFITVIFILLTPFAAPFVASHFNGVPSSLIPAEPDKLARDYISNLKDNNFAKVSEMTDSRIQITQDQATAVSKELVDAQLDTGKIVYVSKKINNNVSGYELTYEFNNNTQNKKYLDVHTIIYITDNGLKVVGIEAQSNDKSIINSETLFDFKKEGLSWALLIILSLFVTWSAIYYVKNSPKPRWWVLLVILLITLKLGLSQSGFSGNLGLYMESTLNPNLIFSISIPIGVLYYWIARKKIFAKEQILADKEIQNQNSTN